jgi:hypothetical protein
VYVLLGRYINNGLLSILAGSFCKSLLLFVFAFLFVNELGLPRMFLTTMGVMQLYTGLIGGVIAHILTSRE